MIASPAESDTSFCQEIHILSQELDMTFIDTLELPPVIINTTYSSLKATISKYADGAIYLCLPPTSGIVSALKKSVMFPATVLIIQGLSWDVDKAVEIIGKKVDLLGFEYQIRQDVSNLKPHINNMNDMKKELEETKRLLMIKEQQILLLLKMNEQLIL